MNMIMIIIVIYLLAFINFSSLDQMLTTNIGQDVTFSCIFPNQSQVDQISFMHQTTGDILSLGLELFFDESLSNNHMKLTRFSSNRLDLKIFSVNQNDSGLYTCMFNDEKLSAYLLEIFIPPRFVSFYPLEASVSYSVNSSMNLSCHAYAVPSANVTWIYRNKNKQLKTIHNGEDVYISSLRSSDSGSYECIASNGYHVTISRSFYVTVQYPPRAIIKKDLDLHKRPIQIECEICSMPLSTSQWVRNGHNISNEQDFIIKTNLISIDNEECLITILDIYESSNEKSGRYGCQAENLLGHSSDYIDFQSKLVPHLKSRNEHIVLSSPSNSTNSISRSSECLSELLNLYVLSIFITINVLYSL